MFILKIDRRGQWAAAVGRSQGTPKGVGFILIGPGGQFCAETALDWKINYVPKTTMPSEIFTYSYRVHQGESGDVF